MIGASRFYLPFPLFQRLPLRYRCPETGNTLVRYTSGHTEQGGFRMQNWRKIKQATGLLTALIIAASMSAFAQGGATILKPAEMGKLMPQSVFYRGQQAPTQLRNSGGIKFADGFFVLTSLVDTSGYSTGVAAKYQAYFITEVPIKVGHQSLTPGAYGIGFIDNDKFIVTDLGAHEILTVASATDTDLKRPMPLQILSDSGGGFRFYAGRKYVVLNR
jgi:hypothetical protein